MNELKEIWAVFESYKNQSDLNSSDRDKIYDYDCMRTFTNEQDAIKYQHENSENRICKLIRLTH